MGTSATQNSVILDSGNRRSFDTGAVRDMAEGKGRPSLMPLYVAGHILHADYIMQKIAVFMQTKRTDNLYWCLTKFASLAYGDSVETMLLEVSKHFEDGARKYGENNWQKGLPIDCYMDSAVRHYLKYRRGDQDEAHDRAFVWNLMCCIWEVDWHGKNS